VTPLRRGLLWLPLAPLTIATANKNMASDFCGSTPTHFERAPNYGSCRVSCSRLHFLLQASHKVEHQINGSYGQTTDCRPKFHQCIKFCSFHCRCSTTILGRVSQILQLGTHSYKGMPLGVTVAMRSGQLLLQPLGKEFEATRLVEQERGREQTPGRMAGAHLKQMAE